MRAGVSVESGNHYKKRSLPRTGFGIWNLRFGIYNCGGGYLKAINQVNRVQTIS